MGDPDAPLDAPLPRRLTRRGFVKGCLYASAAGVAAMSAQAMVNPLAILSRGPRRRVDYIGATVVGGPAPQGIPLVPLAVGPGGELMGNPRPPGIEGSVLDWYRYCGHARSPALRVDYAPGDELLRYATSPDRLDDARALRAATGREDVGWYFDRLGEAARVQDFPAPGFGAPVGWRREGPGHAVTAVVLKVDPAQLTFTGAPEAVVREGFMVATPDGLALLAFATFCKHLCCVPGWRESARALRQGRFDTVFCACHDSVYDPLHIRGDFFLLQEDAAA